MTMEEVLEQVKFHAELRGLSHHTVAEYRTRADLFQKHYGKPATELGIEDIQNYLHHLYTEKHLSTGTINTYNSGLRFLYNVVLDRPLNLFKIPCHRKKRGFPDILTREEVNLLLSSCDNLRDKCILTTTYSAGLRLDEVNHLKVSDIDSNKMQIFVRKGKGGKDRFAILSQTNLKILREYWKAYRPKEDLFLSRSRKPMTNRSVGNIFHKACNLAGITKKVSIHTLRHSFATHLLEDGVSIYHIKQLLGHADISTTCFYLHLVKISELKVQSPLDRFAGGVSND